MEKQKDILTDSKIDLQVDARTGTGKQKVKNEALCAVFIDTSHTLQINNRNK